MIGVLAVLLSTAQPVCAAAMTAPVPCGNSQLGAVLACCCENAPASSTTTQTRSGDWLARDQAPPTAWLIPAREKISVNRTLATAINRARPIPLSILHSSYLI